MSRVTVGPIQALALAVAGFILLTSLAVSAGRAYADYLIQKDASARLAECVERATRLGIVITPCYQGRVP